MRGELCGLEDKKTEEERQKALDAFEKLGVDRKLVLDEGELEGRFRALSKVAHPDAGGDAGEFEELRKVYEELKSPLGRLRLALGDGDARGSVPGEVMDLFGPVAGAMQEVEQFLAKRAAARSDLGRAMMDAGVPALKGKVEGLGERLVELEEELVARFGSFDEQGWGACQDQMGETARGLAFVIKWRGQLRGAVGELFEALLG